MSLRRKTFVLLFARVLFVALGDIALARGMKNIGAVNLSSSSALWHVFIQIITNGMIWLGIALLLAYFVCHLLVLSWADYSYVLPTSAAYYVIVPLLGLVLLHEHVGLMRWVGATIVSLGVILVGLTPPHTREVH
jgi:drug/metabolite transporter (DMT)-like permease